MIAQSQTATRSYSTPAAPGIHTRRTAYVPSTPARPAHATQPTALRGGAAADVRDLLDAAGPLFVRDIAGGAGLAPHEAAQVVAHLLAHGVLRRDEWGRLSLRSTPGDAD